MINVTIPIVAQETLSVDEFKRRMAKHFPTKPPKFSLGDVAIRQSILMRGSPVVITAVEAKATSRNVPEWRYTALGIGEIDASTMSSTFSERELKSLDDE